MKKPKKNWLEWSVFAVSAGLIAAIVGFLLYASSTTGQGPPDIQVRIGEPEPHAGYFAVPIKIVNQGDHTAEGVQVEVVLKAGGQEERGQFEIQFLPRHGSREAWVTFKTDPRQGALEARVLGYEKP